jgi:hypothetical protein
VDINAAIRNYVIAVILLFVIKITIGDDLLQDSKNRHQHRPGENLEQVEISE